MNKHLLGLIFSGLTLSGFAQSVGVGTTTPQPSAQLDITSNSRGILIPRMHDSIIAKIVNPAKGLMVFDSTNNQLMVNMGTSSKPDWENLVAGSGWGLAGNAKTSRNVNFIGTTDQQPLQFRVGNQAAGRLDTDGSVYLGTGVPTQNVGTPQFGPFTVAIGDRALGATTSATSNTAVGCVTLITNTTGSDNTAIGTAALEFNVTGSDNTAVGVNALASNSASNNTAVGSYSQPLTTSGTDNSSLGRFSLDENQGGSQNTAIGYLAVANNINGMGNTGVGFQALAITTAASFNTAIGYNAGNRFNNGFNNCFLGANTDVNGNGYFNVIAIGQDVTATASSQARIGNSATNSIGGFANWTNFSDGRYKKNMKENVKGIDFIMRLRPLTYNLDVQGINAKLQEGSGATKGGNTTKVINASMQQATAQKEAAVFSGFVAQEVEQAAHDAGYEFSGVDKPQSDKDFYGLRYSDFVVPLVKAVQEQQRMIEELRKEISDLKKQSNH